MSDIAIRAEALGTRHRSGAANARLQASSALTAKRARA